MIPLLDEIEHSYAARCDDHSEFNDLWKKVISRFPPDISKCTEVPRPSLLLTRDAGDLGLAIMWIVQTVLVRPILQEIGTDEIIFSQGEFIVGESTIGALAHSEDRNFPAILHETDEGIRISGKKKYITGGRCADFLLVTARKEGDDAVSSLLMIPREAIAPESLQSLSLSILRTIEHASLEMHNLAIPRHTLVQVEPSQLHRLLKRWSIMERAFIAEAFLGLCAYIAQKLENRNLISINIKTEISSLLEKTREFVTEMLYAALSFQRIPDMPYVDIIKCYTWLKESISSTPSLPPEITLRLSELALFEKMQF